MSLLQKFSYRVNFEMKSLLLMLFVFTLSSAVPLQNAPEQSFSSSAIAGIQQGNQEPETYSNSEDNIDKDNQFSATQILENPSYDPNLYSSFIPQDAIQQYVNQYGGPYVPAAYASAFQNPAFAVQTGYEGYLVPDVDALDNYSGTYNFFRGLFPRALLGWIGKAAAIIFSAVGIALFGGAITTAICSLTPLCTISFAGLPFLRIRDTAETIGKAIGAEITPERVRRTAEFVKSAIAKYSELQNSDENGNHNIQKIGKNLRN